MDTLKLPDFCIDHIKTGTCYQIKVGNIYDLSKFWIIINFKELALFDKYLTHFYSTNSKKPIPATEVEANLICIIYRNKSYHRAKILPTVLPEPKKIRVFMIDCGYIGNVDIENVFYIDEKHKSTPRFAYRACLANLSPLGLYRIQLDLIFEITNFVIL